MQWSGAPAYETKGNRRAIAQLNGHAREPLRVLPHNIEAEQAVIGAILMDNRAFDSVSDFLEPLHFYDALHAKIYTVVAQLISSRQIARPLSVATYLETDVNDPRTNVGPAPALSTAQYMGRLVGNAATNVDVRGYANLLRDLSQRRDLICLCDEARELAYRSPVDASPQLQMHTLIRNVTSLDERAPHAIYPLSLDDFMKLKMPEREFVLDNLLFEQGIAMVYAGRGIGKTWFALGIGYAIAAGGKFLRWQADRARRVLHVCGEMAAVDLRTRLGALALGGDRRPESGFYQILSADLLPSGLPDLALPEGQSQLDRLMRVKSIEVVIFDNVSTLFRAGVENEAESWLPIQDWLLRLRRQGRTVILIHHAGKNGAQRGTSRREDVLDLVLKLSRPEGYTAVDGARFAITFEKARGLQGNAQDPFEAKLQSDERGYVWTVAFPKEHEVIELHEEGCSLRGIAEKTGVPKTNVQRIVERHHRSNPDCLCGK